MKKIGLMLSGGGARGAYQVGVIKALMETKLMDNITHLAGASIGAINTYLLMNFSEFETIEKFWQEVLNNKIVFHKKDLKRKNKKNALVDTTLLEEKTTDFFNKYKQDKYLKQGFCVVCMANSKNDFLNFKKLEKKVINLNNEIDAYSFVQASASMPLIFGHTIIDGKYYFDGGILDNNPVVPLIENGCNIIFSVGLANTPGYKLEKYEYTNCLIIDLYKRFSISRGILNHIISIFNFSKNKQKKYINLGYKNTLKLIKYLKEIDIIDENNNINHTPNNGFKLYRLKDVLKLKKGIKL